MKILALEFSSPVRSVAVAVEGVVRGRAEERGGRETRAFAMIGLALQQAGMHREEIECIAVGTGPGSYTGIRIAIAIAQGWQLARTVTLLGLRSADCVAAQRYERGRRGFLNVLIDAQRGEWFAARYELRNEWRLVEDFILLTPEERARRTAADEMFIRPDLEPASNDAACPVADTLARLAAHRTDFVEGAELEPIYLRKADFVKAPPPRMSAGKDSHNF